jgi:4-amino-4-deoxy-L-arabinose transferase-like glycosyltransferase
MRVRVPPFAPKWPTDRWREAERAIQSGLAQGRRDVLFPAILAIFTLCTRTLCRGTVYFADGPAHIQVILDKSYMIQFPGYFLFNRLAGLFPDPVFAISAINILFSMAGVVVFYFTACFFGSRWNAMLAALAYSTVFYAWFSGEIHSTYASQLLFPVALFYIFLRHERDHARWQLWLAAAVFALGSGFRPSDGVFLLPMAIYLGCTRLKRIEALQFFAIFGVLCLGWIVPTYLGMQNETGGLTENRHYVYQMLTVLSVLRKLNLYTLANFARYVVPLTAALWPVLGFAISKAARDRADWRVRALMLWIVPGSLFFVLVMITDPVYLNFLTPAILLLAMSAPRAMAVTAVWNLILFVMLSPIPSRSIVVDVADCYVLQYTRYGVQHHTGLRLPELLKARN